MPDAAAGWLLPVVFVATYLAMAAGRVPRFRIDRTGMAFIGAVVLLACGAVTSRQAAGFIDLPTLVMLFGLMVLSTQFEIAGAYGWCAARIAGYRGSPLVLLALVVAVAGGLSAVVANDVVAFAMTPLLCAGLTARGLDPRPYLIALAGASNAGSAATIIGNPQNILIAQAGALDFWRFLLVCGPPALMGMACVFATVAFVWHGAFRRQAAATNSVADPPTVHPPAVDRPALAKALAATMLLVALFASPLPHEVAVAGVAALLFVSRRHETRSLMAGVDWSLIVLFASLFVVTGAMSASAYGAGAAAWIALGRVDLAALGPLAGFSLLASNTVGNVPAVMLLLSVWPAPGEAALQALAVLSTHAGNLLLIGSLANLIVSERARRSGVVLDFRTHARCGIPMALASLGASLAWFSLLGPLAWR
ncbi:SLC13 family permease [Arenibaculum sp.]|jgi:Na+/H+ antiporter NhaD/arsenite permease-like protein|uniref:SLC13 family permease n=1 Tax=Arenibaculum sp. TaxID=2865862 RepID=UPI002E12A73F|nr:SLC13 family permease [Arenibaculum sp.]